MARNEAGDLVKEVFVLHVSVSVGGVKREAEELSDGPVGANGHERVKHVKETVLHVDELAAARKLETALRALSDRHGTQLTGFPGFLASPAGRDAFMASLGRLDIAVRAHNERTVPGFASQPHPVSYSARALAIGQTFGPEDVAEVLASVSADLREAHGLLMLGKLNSLMNWLKRGVRCAQLVPALNANAVQTALDALRAARNAAAKQVRQHNLEEALARGDDDARKVVLDLPETREAGEAVEAALGWLSPASATAFADASGA